MIFAFIVGLLTRYGCCCCCSLNLWLASFAYHVTLRNMEMYSNGEVAYKLANLTQ